MANHSLVMPFLTDDVQFARGVEFGLLWARMRRGDEDVIGDFFMLPNESRVMLAARCLGWTVSDLSYSTPGWFWCRLTKG